jgi:hypothetical protein
MLTVERAVREIRKARSASKSDGGKTSTKKDDKVKALLQKCSVL